MNKHFLFAAIFGLLLAGCQPKSNEESQNQVAETVKDSAAMENEAWEKAKSLEPPQPLHEKLATLADSAKAAWAELNEVDKKKFGDIALIIKEFKKIKTVDKALLDSVVALQQQATKQHYDATNMNNSTIMDSYDQTIELLMEKVDRLETTTKYLDKCRACMDTFEAIRQADSKDLTQRIHYSSFAQELNALLEKEKTAIEKLEEKYKQIKAVNTFAK